MRGHRYNGLEWISIVPATGIIVPNHLIYVQESGLSDFSRWLAVSLRGEGTAVLHLSDLCHPGRQTSIGNATTDLTLLREVLDSGALQLTTPRGYVLIGREGGHLAVEFKGHDDTGPTRVLVSVEDVRNRLDHLAEQSTASI